MNYDPYKIAAFPFRNRLVRMVWGIVYVILFRPSPRVFFGWRNVLLRLFGAKVAKSAHIYPRCRIWAPWNLACDDVGTIADGAVVYNPSLVTIRSHAIVSQEAYLCGASHDYNDPAFPLISAPITLEPYSWVCARATVQMGVTLGEGAVLALGGVATCDLDAWSVYGGIPAKKIRSRNSVSNKTF